MAGTKPKEAMLRQRRAARREKIRELVAQNASVGIHAAPAKPQAEKAPAPTS